MADVKKIAEQLVGLTVKEVQELADVLKADYGIEPAAAAAVAVAGGGGAEAAAEKTAFDVILTSAGASKLNVVKIVKDLTGLGLKEAKDLVDGAPGNIKENVDKATADDIANKLKEAGADVLTVHFEACIHLHRTVQAIKALGLKAGVAINPHTSVNLLIDIISDLDLVLIMSVNPGFGGQKFIENTYHKIASLREIIRVTKSKAMIEIDGGVDLNNYKKLIDSGANVLVAGNTVFSSANPSQTISELKKV